MAKHSLKTCSQKGTRRHPPRVMFGKMGNVSLSRELMTSLNLKVGDKVSFYQSDNDPKDWYLLPHDEDGFTLRSNGIDPLVSGRFNCVRLTDMVLTSIDADVNLDYISLRVVLSQERHGYPIITSEVKQMATS
jgi:hypothetical protein